MANIVTERSVLEVTPRVCLHDVHTTIRARNLPPLHDVTFKANLNDQKGIPYCSHAYYMTDEEGRVDLDVEASIGGSYKGVFPDGLLTTLKPAPGQFKYHRLVSKDTSQPWNIMISVHKGQESSKEWSTPIDIVELERHLLLPGTRRIPVKEGRVRGVLYLPAGDGPFPGVIDMFGGVGGCVEHRSAMLASRGIASFALAYFQYDDLPKTFDRLEIEYFQEAVQFLISFPGVIEDKCGVIGTCLGGFMALMMSIYIKEIKAIMTINTAAIASNAILTYKGVPVNTELPMNSEHMTVDSEFRVRPVRHLWEDNLISEHPHLLPVHKIDANKTVLLIAGDDDSMLGHLSAKALEASMKSHNKPNVSSIIYPGAGHMIEPPYGVLIEHAYQVSSKGKNTGKDPPSYVMYWGGTPEGQCSAQVALWGVIQEYFKTHITTKNDWPPHNEVIISQL